MSNGPAGDRHDGTGAATRVRVAVVLGLGVLALVVTWRATGTLLVGTLICAGFIWYAGAGVFTALLDAFSRRGAPIRTGMPVAAVCGACIVAMLPVSLRWWWGFPAVMGLLWLDVIRRTWPREAFEGPRLRAEIFEPPRRGGARA